MCTYIYKSVGSNGTGREKRVRVRHEIVFIAIISIWPSERMLLRRRIYVYLCITVRAKLTVLYGVVG